MAVGDIKWFAQGLIDLGNKVHNLSADTLKLGVVTSATVPSLLTDAPHWGGTGTTNFATTQVGVAGGYVGPITLASVTWVSVAGVATLRATDITIPQNASGFTNGAYGIIYNHSDASKRAIGFIELSAAGDVSIATFGLTIDFQGAGTDVLRITPT